MLLVLLQLLLLLLLCIGASSYVGVGSAATSAGDFIANALASTYLLLLLG